MADFEGHILITGIKEYILNFFTEDKIKEAFKKNDHSYISSLYKVHYPVVKRFVLYNSGVEEDAKDLLQEALIIILQKVNTDNFALSCSFLTYLYSIVKNLWLKELRQKRANRVVVKDLEDIEDVDCHINFEKEYRFNVEYFIFRMHFNRLSKSCKEILKMVFEKKSYNEVAVVLNLKSEGVVRRRKYRCKESLIGTIKKDPKYIEMNR